MKTTVKDLKRVISWIETYSQDMIIDVDGSDDRYILFKCQDKYASHVTIKVFRDSNMQPRITKEDPLP